MKAIVSIILAAIATAAICSPVRSGLGCDGEMFSTEHEITAADYVSDGLTCLFDGIENAGWGEHDDLASSWMDLVGGCEMSFSQGVNAYFEDNCLWRDRMHGNLTTPIPWPMANTTIEIVCDVEGPFTGSTNPRIMGTDHTTSSASSRLEFDAYEGITTGGGPMTPRCYWALDGKTGNKYALFGREPGGLWCITARVFPDSVEWIDSACRKSTTMGVPVEGFAAHNTLLNVGAWRGTSSAMTGRIFCIRFYNRILTDAEIAYNNFIDKIRFSL